MATKRTDELEPGDKLLLPGGIVRTFSYIEPSGFHNIRNEPIVHVMYSEGKTEEWSAGNSAIARTKHIIVP